MASFSFYLTTTFLITLALGSSSGDSSSDSSSDSSEEEIECGDNFSLCDIDDIECGLLTLSSLLDGYIVSNASIGTEADDYDLYKDARWEVYNLDNNPLAIIFVDSNNDVVLTTEFLEYFDICYGVHSSLISHHSSADRQ